MDESIQKALFDELIGALHERGLSKEIKSIPDLIEYIQLYLIPNLQAYKTNIEGIMANPALKVQMTVEQAQGLAAELERVRETWTKDPLGWIDRTSGINGLNLAVRTLFTGDFIPKFKEIITELKKNPRNIGPDRFAFLQYVESTFRPLEATLKILYKETKAEDDTFVAFIKTIKKSGRNTGRGIVSAEQARREAIVAEQMAALNAEQARINAARAAVRKQKEVSNAELLAAKNVYNVESNTEETRLPALQRKAERDRIAAEKAAAELAAAEAERAAARASNSQNVNMNALNKEHERLRKAAENAKVEAAKSARKLAKRGHLAALNNSNSNVSGINEGPGPAGGAAGGAGGRSTPAMAVAAAAPAAAAPASAAPAAAAPAPAAAAAAAAGGWGPAAAPPASPRYGNATPPGAPASPAFGSGAAAGGWGPPPMAAAAAVPPPNAGAAAGGPGGPLGNAAAAAAPAAPPLEITKEMAEAKRAEALKFYEEHKEITEGDEAVEAAYKQATSKTIKAAKTIYDRAVALISAIETSMAGEYGENNQGGGRRRRKTLKHKHSTKAKKSKRTRSKRY